MVVLVVHSKTIILGGDVTQTVIAWFWSLEYVKRYRFVSRVLNLRISDSRLKLLILLIVIVIVEPISVMPMSFNKYFPRNL